MHVPSETVGTIHVLSDLKPKSVFKTGISVFEAALFLFTAFRPLESTSTTKLHEH